MATYDANSSKTSIGAGAFDYDFGALENTDNKLTKSYTNLMYVSVSSTPTRNSVTVIFHSYTAFSGLSKGRLLLMDSLKWAPAGFTTWVLERDQNPGMVNLRENRVYVREVAVKLIEEKRQELMNGTSRRDLLSLLGSFCVPFTELW